VLRAQGESHATSIGFKWGGCRSLTGLALDDLDPTSRSCDFALNEDAHSYAHGLSRRIELPAAPPDRTRAALWQLLAGWGHQTAWTERSAAGALLVVGFSRVCRREYGQGEFRSVDGHHRDVGPELALLESTILEARK